MVIELLPALLNNISVGFPLVKILPVSPTTKSADPLLKTNHEDISNEGSHELL